MIKILVVDDSPLFAAMLSSRLSDYEGFQVVGTAGNPYEARDKILELDPDIMTLDIEMPRMDGVSFLKKLLPQYAIPVIVMSSRGSRREDAKAAGAVSFRLKPSGPGEALSEFVGGIAEDIMRVCGGGGKPRLKAKGAMASVKPTVKPAVQPSMQNPYPSAPSTPAKSVKVQPVPSSRTSAADSAARAAAQAANAAKAAANMTSGKGIPVTPVSASSSSADKQPVITGGKGGIYSRNGIEIIALGASTGGTDALEVVILGLNDQCPPVVITQHMPPVFTGMYAQRLNRTSSLNVFEAEDGMRLEKGMCVIAAGGKHMEVMRDARGYFVTSREGEKVSGHCPSVDKMFTSLVSSAGNKVVAALLTGMGADGAKGLLALRKAGAYTIGQNKETCVVYGMPMEAYKMGAVCEEAPLTSISKIILKKLNML
ncbi:MAG: chemotaxis-specific protein-glutamate methyltransferase CheB [Ruminococcus sp.]|nr:chemotaxis-specific protein-glutamate methyltransferase CheB [Ruminococcus sp.]